MVMKKKEYQTIYIFMIFIYTIINKFTNINLIIIALVLSKIQVRFLNYPGKDEINNEIINAPSI